MASSHDYVVVGAGSAGCALAARLSEDPANRVLLIEAGPRSKRKEIPIPAGFSALFKTEVDWNFETTPQRGLDGRRIYVPRGRMVGGTSGLNAQMYVRGAREDYDGWAREGAEGWSYDDVLPAFRRAERNARGADAFHGAGGPAWISDQRDPNPLTQAFVASAIRHGIPRNDDVNGPALDGVGLVQVTQRRGRRWTTADAYLEPARSRANLEVRPDVRALGIELSGRRVAGVRVAGDGGDGELVTANREVILAAGTYGSPQLLMLSGIGPADELRALGIDVAVDAPGVGANLQDHLVTPMHVASRRPLSLAGAGNSPRELARYLLRHRGRLTSNVGEAAAFVRTDPSLPAPDLELIFAPVLYLAEGLEEPEEHGLTIGVIALQPASRGRVSLASADPAAAPVIDPAYLSDPEGADLRVALHGLRLARKIVATPSLSAFAGEEMTPGADVTDDDGLAAHVRRLSHTIYHPVGTCRMGVDDEAVVDPQLRVRGVDGLRVADCSVIPRITRGHTHAPAVMIGERAAQLIAAG